jgi:hypothetical protein
MRHGRSAPPTRTTRRRIGACVALAALALAPRAASASPDESLPVRDPIVDELRVLDLYHRSLLGDRFRLPHLGTQPAQHFEFQGPGGPLALTHPVLRISIARLERALGREAVADRMADPVFLPTPRLYSYVSVEDERVEISAGLEGAGETFDERSRYRTGSGAHLRSALAFDQWLVSTHFYAGHVDRARTFADPIVPGNDVIVHTEDTYVGYTGAGGVWSGRFGRTRWHWGPGDEASLILSKTAPAMTGVSMAAHFGAIRMDVITLNATLDQARGEQLAAHRLEWQPYDALRLGATETARYQSENWQPLYLIGAIPYVLVQRFLHQDSPDSLERLRNNVMIGFDAAWRIAGGTRVYGEILIDDLHARTNDNPNKIAWQLGWEGAGSIAGQRLTWGGELTRVWRHVYTSFFGREYSLQSESIGFPTGPDARRLRLRGAWDPSPDWQMFGAVAQTDRGENRLGAPYLPGSPKPEPGSFEGVVERTRDIEAGLRWWPAGGVDVSVSGGYRWIEDEAHVPGASREGAIATIRARLMR